MKAELATIADRLRPDLPMELIEQFSSGIDERWFAAFPEETLIAHLDGASKLSEDNPFVITAEAEAGSAGEIRLSVITTDSQGIFSLIAGVLAASGFGVSGGEIFTVRKSETKASPAVRTTGTRRRGPTRRRPLGEAPQRRIIVDVFRGFLRTSATLPEWIEELYSRFAALGPLLATGGEDDRRRARALVQEWVADAIGRGDEGAGGYLYPVDLELDGSKPGVNRMTVLAEDTPFFLYALGAALAQEGISIERLEINTREGRVEDVIEFTDENGTKIDDSARLDRVKMGVLLTKQFTYFLAEAPNPQAALERFERMAKDLAEPGGGRRWLDIIGNPLVMRDLAALLGASDYLWEDFIRGQYESLLPMLKPHLGTRSFSEDREGLKKHLNRALAQAKDWNEKKAALNDFKDREIFRIDLDHILTDGFDFRKLSRRLTRLAEVVVRSALALSEERQVSRFGRPRGAAGLTAPWAAFGLGKMGGSALGYASDIELLFVYADSGRTDGAEPTTNADYFERLLRDAVSLIEAKQEGIFQIDLRLRPYGKSGILATSLEAFCSYYSPDGEAASLEKLALVRLRKIAGDDELGSRVERIRDELIYAPGSLDRKDLARLRRRQLADKTTPGIINAKFSVGALVDLESTVQILQSEYGVEDVALRTPSIHAALGELGRLEVIDNQRAAGLSEAYDFLRNLINALRMLRGSAMDLNLPATDSHEYRHLARRMGYRTAGILTPDKKLKLEYETRSAQVRAFVEAALGPSSLPGVPAGNMADLVLSENLPEGQVETLLTRAGYRNTPRARANIAALAGAGRRRRRFARLAVLATDMTRRSADPDMALNNWERFVGELEDPEDHFDELLAQPSRLEVLLKLFAGSQFLADTLIRRPDLFDRATDAEVLAEPRDADSHREELEDIDGHTADRDSWRDALRAYRRKEILRIGTKDLALGRPLPIVTAEIADLAEGIIDAALRRILREKGLSTKGFVVLAFGKLGGRELNYSSDIDILGLRDEENPAGEDPTAWQGILEALRGDLSVATIEGAGYRVDLRLRPWGRSGDLVQTVRGLKAYYGGDAALWEIQALLKLRPVAGDLALGARFLREVAPVFNGERSLQEIGGAIERNRRAALQHKASPLRRGERDVKDGRGGIRDVEFLVQGLQLAHLPKNAGLRTGNTMEALGLLKKARILDTKARDELETDYRLLRKVEHHLQLFDDRQVHHLPDTEERLEPIARRVLTWNSGPAELLDTVDAAFRRVFHHYRHFLLNPAGIDPEA